jgi:channel protein (hemolysin III family)
MLLASRHRYWAIGFQEPFSSWTHLLAAGVFAVLAISLLKRSRGVGDSVALGIFAFSAVFLLSMSGVYHLLPYDSAGRAVLKRLDHAAIFVLIAGTFTPIHAIIFKGVLRWGILALIWVSAVAGLTLKTIFFADVPEWLSVTFYLGLSWVGIISGVFLWKRFGARFIRSLLGGGACYTIGAILDGFLCWPTLIDGVIESHEIFHLAVIGGIAFHWRFVLHCVNRAEIQIDEAAGS